jgi:CMP-N,N'-diacetyllegionaminic acid synthase
MSKTLALIPARAGSKGVLDKNIRLLGGHPLMAWTIAACKKANLIDQIIVSTDSTNYAKIAKKYNAEVPFLRPKDLSSDYSNDYEFVMHALDWLALRGKEPDYIIHMRPTTPFRNPILINQAIKTFKSRTTATALRSVQEMSESAYKTFEVDSSGLLSCLGDNNSSLDSANIARQSFPKTYSANGYVDVLSTEFIRENSLLHGDFVMPFITPNVIEVDTEDNFSSLEYQLVKSPEMTKLFFD